MPGWKIWTVGDDICLAASGAGRPPVGDQSGSGLLRRGAGHNAKTNLQCLRHDPARHDFHQRRADHGQRALVGRPRRGTPVLDWQGRPYDPAKGPAAHPNSRFTVSRDAVPELFADGRRRRRACRSRRSCSAAAARRSRRWCIEARDWAHGVLVGAGMASETTAAATGDVGVVRRDPMAMKPFSGYNFADYWGHWLSMAKRLKQPPGSSTSTGSAAMPPAGSSGRASARTCACSPGSSRAATAARRRWIRPSAPCRPATRSTSPGLRSTRRPWTTARRGHVAWRKEASEIGSYLESYGARLPAAMREELARLSERLTRA